MKNLNLRSLNVFLALAISFGFSSFFLQSVVKAQIKLPDGNWSVSTRPYMGTGYKSLPVRVTSVTSDLASGIGVTLISVENTSSQRVDGIKLAWYVSAKENPETILLQGAVPSLTIPGGIAANDAERLSFPVVSFAKIYKPLLKGKKLDGNFILQIAVIEARFEDGVSQKFLAKTDKGSIDAKFLKVAYRSLAKPLEDFCPNQACRAIRANGDPGTGPVLGYDCESSSGQICTNMGSSCTVKMCGDDDGGGKGPIKPILE